MHNCISFIQINENYLVTCVITGAMRPNLFHIIFCLQKVGKLKMGPPFHQGPFKGIYLTISLWLFFIDRSRNILLRLRNQRYPVHWEEFLLTSASFDLRYY